VDVRSGAFTDACEMSNESGGKQVTYPVYLRIPLLTGGEPGPVSKTLRRYFLMDRQPMIDNMG
jgi:hypothetical protein